jgi:uncharacterized protein YukE
MARMICKDLIDNLYPSSLEDLSILMDRLKNDLKNLEELFEEQMKQAYFQGWEDKWHVDRTDLSKAFEDFYKTYKK